MGSIVEGSGSPRSYYSGFYVNVSGIRLRSLLSSQPLTISAPWVLLRFRWSIPLVSPWVTVSSFLPGNMEAKLKPTTFSSLLLFFRVFLSTLLLTPQRFSTFECCLLGLFTNNNVTSSYLHKHTHAHKHTHTHIQT